MEIFHILCAFAADQISVQVSHSAAAFTGTQFRSCITRSRATFCARKYLSHSHFCDHKKRLNPPLDDRPTLPTQQQHHQQQQRGSTDKTKLHSQTIPSSDSPIMPAQWSADDDRALLLSLVQVMAPNGPSKHQFEGARAILDNRWTLSAITYEISPPRRTRDV